MVGVGFRAAGPPKFARNGQIAMYGPPLYHQRNVRMSQGWSAQMYTTFAGMNHSRPGWKTPEPERINQSTSDFLGVLWGLKERRKTEVNRLP